MVSEESSSKSSSEVQNSATEISTDSEFAQDEPTPTREIPSVAFNDFHVTKTRGSGKSNYPRKIQVTSGYIQKPINENPKPKPDIELKLSPLVPSTPDFKNPAPVLLPRTEGYALNRTQSTGGIAAKVSLELKKRYLLGESGTNGIQKSGSASTLDTKFKSFQNTISDCQKLLKPAQEISASMHVFCSQLDERHSPVLSPRNSFVFPVFNGKHTEDKSKELPPPDVTITTINENKHEKSQGNESESRPRSPVHEASILVPSIDWSKQNQAQSSDSLSMSSSDSENEASKAPDFLNIPRVEVHAAKDSDKEDIPLDSLCPEAQKAQMEVMSDKSSSSKVQEQCKSITSEKKTLNQPKSLPNLESSFPEIHKALHNKIKSDKEDSPEEVKSIKTVSGKSSPDATAALTETELSDWARDENVSDSMELDISRSSEKKKSIKVAKLGEFEKAVNHHVCGKNSKDAANKIIITAAMNNVLSVTLDSIEYMDTGTETSSDDGVVDSQNGYVLFKNEDDLAEDSLNPHINEIFEAKNIYLTKKETDEGSYLVRNIGYCEIAKESNNFGGEIIDLKPADLEKLKQKQALTDHEEDSLLILETGTTTEENTCSDSTVKNITEIIADVKENPNKPSLKIENLHKQRLEDKLAKVKAEKALLNEQTQEANEKENIEKNLQFDEHCQRLQSKIEFGNAKDSIDIRKSRRKSKTETPQKPDLIQQEKDRIGPPKDITLNLTPVSPADMLYKKENIKKERDVNKKLIEEMVMTKMKAENKSLERKRRNRNVSSLSPCRPYEIQTSNTTDIVSQINLNKLDKRVKNVTPNSDTSSIYTTPDLLSNSVPLKNIQTTNNVLDNNSSTEKYLTPTAPFTPKQNSSRPLSVFSTFTDIRKLRETPLTNPENFSLPDIRKNLFTEDFKTPNPPPRYNRPSDVARTAEKMKESARARARQLSNEDLGLSPEDKLNKLREKVNRRGKENEVFDVNVQESIESLVLNTERRNSQLYSNDTLTKKRINSFKRSKSGDSEIHQNISGSNRGLSVGVRPKSVSEIPKNLNISKSAEINTNESKKIFKSDPNLLDTNYTKPKKKSKERERRKSIAKLIVGIFTKKSSSSNGTKGLFAKLSPKSKAVSKEAVTEEPLKRRSNSEVSIQKREITPPPIPPLPVNYAMNAADESGDDEILEHKRQDRGSCDTLDQSGNFETSMSSLTGRRSGKARRVSRQAQLKRHRMAQEIQRKLEETEVKTRELEHRGVEVEKALRGEDNRENLKDESELLQEWFDLMRDRSELRRYEKELMVRAQELELEDQHARLQAELRERLETNESKTEEDLKIEESIINEMMEIVAKRDSIIAVLEEDRLRYVHEDKDLEEQMLVKGLMLTPIEKSSEN